MSLGGRAGGDAGALDSVTTPSGGDAPDPVAVLVQRTTGYTSGPAVMPERLRAGSGALAELGDDAEPVIRPTPVAAPFREPQVAIGAGRDAVLSPPRR